MKFPFEPVNKIALIDKAKDTVLEIEDVFIDKVKEDADAVGSLVKSIENKCQMIDKIFESIGYDLFELSEIHIDDNGRDIADSLQKKFKKVHDDYYWQVHEEVCDSKDEHSWMKSSFLYMLRLLSDDEDKQTLTIPKLREHYENITRGEDLTKDEKETEFNKWIDFLRKDFNLDEAWK